MRPRHRALPWSLALILALGAIPVTACDDDPAPPAGDTGVLIDAQVADTGGTVDSKTTDGPAKLDGKTTDGPAQLDGPAKLDGAGKHDGAGKQDANPACPAQKPSGFCVAATAPVCTYGTETCRCLSVCSGVPPPPGQTHAWVCEPPPPAACPSSPPTNGTTCKNNGLVCTYGHCAVTTATCVNGIWLVKTTPPPP